MRRGQNKGQNTRQNKQKISPMNIQHKSVLAYEQEELQQILLVVRQIQELGLRPQQGDRIQSLIPELEALLARQEGTVQLSPQQDQQLGEILASLSPEDIERIDSTLGQPSVEVAILTPAELQELLLLLKAIQQLGIRPQQTEQVQSFIAELEAISAAGLPEAIIPAPMAREMQALADELTLEEKQQLEGQLVNGPTRLTATQLQELVAMLREVEKLGLSPLQTISARSLIRDLEPLQAQGQSEIDLQETQAEQVFALLESLSSEEFFRVGPR